MADCRGKVRFAAIETVLTGRPNGAGMLINRDPCANASPLRLRHVTRRAGGNPVARAAQLANGYTGCPTAAFGHNDSEENQPAETHLPLLVYPLRRKHLWTLVISPRYQLCWVAYRMNCLLYFDATN